MSIPSYNRGEWAELYVLAKVLCDQSITVQVHGEGSAQRSLSVLKVKRGTTSTVESFSVNGIGITCDHTSREVQREEICLRVPALLRSIKNGKGNSFHLEEGEEMMPFGEEGEEDFGQDQEEEEEEEFGQDQEEEEEEEEEFGQDQEEEEEGKLESFNSFIKKRNK